MSNWNLGMLVLEERGKRSVPRKTSPSTNIGGRRVLSPLCHPYSPQALLVLFVCVCFFFVSYILVFQFCQGTIHVILIVIGLGQSGLFQDKGVEHFIFKCHMAGWPVQVNRLIYDRSSMHVHTHASSSKRHTSRHTW